MLRIHAAGVQCGFSWIADVAVFNPHAMKHLFLVALCTLTTPQAGVNTTHKEENGAFTSKLARALRQQPPAFMQNWPASRC